MAVETVKSTIITNRDATPASFNNRNLYGNFLTSTKGSAAVDSAASIGSKYILVSVPSNAYISKILVGCTAITSAAADIGVYRNTVDGGAVVDADYFASALSLASILNGSNQTNESTTNTLANQEKPLWQALGVSADPQTTYDIVVTLTAAATAAGTVGLIVEYSV